MKSWRALAISLIAASGLVPLQSSAQNLLVNGSFESGITGWTSSGPPCSPSSQTAGNPATGAGGSPPPPPGQFIAPAAVDGTHVYMGDTGAPGTCNFFQDVTLPAGTSQGHLSFAAGYNFRDFGGGAAGCEADISVTDTANVPLAPPGYIQIASATDDPLRGRPPIVFTTTPGATVRVLVTETSCGGGPVGLVLDNLVLVGGPLPVPTLGGWAQIALILLVAGTAMIALRRRFGA
ncbi:MAG TPA: hypothetical protein VKR38_09300 [Usitatibacter sp.]|nr:hypothetical protein [Usitatibacter sp.]